MKSTESLGEEEEEEKKNTKSSVKKLKRKRMEEMKRAVLAVVMAGVVVFVGGAMAAQHAVGGSQGWDQSTDFKSWASSETFNVGDQLVFKYTQGLHSVVELTDENAYKSCNTGNSVNSMSSGNDVVKLTKPGTRYFACGTAGHCGQGMKLKVTIAAGGAASSPASPSSSPTTASTSSTPTTASTSGSSLPGGASAPLFLLVATLISPLLLGFPSLC